MTRFEVWAPAAGRVELVTRSGRFPMRRGDGGWWRRELGHDGDLDYAFSLDGDYPLPDPRSPWQPDGVFGFSRTLCHMAFDWQDAGFRPEPLPRAVFYELHVGTFTPAGTFLGAIERLDHLVELGATHVELMPVAAFSGEHGWGYDGVAPFAPHPAYGTPDDLKRLVDACHARGLAVVFDVVHNHFGPEGCFLPRFGPYQSGQLGTQWGRAPNLDGADSDEVRRFFIDSALAWLRDYHGDGLRLDAVHALVDRSPLHFLEELRTAVDALGLRLGRPLFLIAESDANDPRLVRARNEGGFGLDAIWNDDFHHALHAFATGERQGYYADFGGCAELVEAYARGFVYAGRYSPHRRRRHGRADPRLSGTQLVGFAQNHDQIGNRPRGDRLSLSLSPERLQVIAGLVLCGPFIPLLFQGEEWGARTPFPFFCDYRDRGLCDSVRHGRRQATGTCGDSADESPDPCAHDTFLSAKLDWGELQRPAHRRMLEWHRSLLRLRKSTRALGAGRLLDLDVRCSDKEGWVLLRRGPVQIAASLGHEKVAIPLDRFAPLQIQLASSDDCAIALDRIELGPDRFVALGPQGLLRGA